MDHTLIQACGELEYILQKEHNIRKIIHIFYQIQIVILI